MKKTDCMKGCTNKQSGFSVIELSAVITIIAIFVVAVLLASEGMTDSAKAMNMSNSTGLLIVNTGHARNAGAVFGNHNTFVSNGVIPQSWRNGVNTVNEFGGNVVITAVSPSIARVTLDTITDKGCLRFLETFSKSSSIREITIDGTTVKGANSPFDYQQTSVICNTDNQAIHELALTFSM